MELPMASQPVQEQPQAQPQQAQQLPQQAQGGQQPPFPASKDEALKFSNDLLQILYDEKTNGNIIQQLDDVKDVSPGKGVGLIAGQLVGNRIADVRGQTKRKIEMRLVADATRAVITELAEMGDREGFFKMDNKSKKEALVTSITMLDKLSQGANHGRA